MHLFGSGYAGLVTLGKQGPTLGYMLRLTAPSELWRRSPAI